MFQMIHPLSRRSCGKSRRGKFSPQNFLDATEDSRNRKRKSPWFPSVRTMRGQGIVRLVVVVVVVIVETFF